MKTYNILNTILDTSNILHNDIVIYADVTVYGNSVISIQSSIKNTSDVDVSLPDFIYEYRIVQDVAGMSQPDIELIAYDTYRNYIDSFFGQSNVSES